MSTTRLLLRRNSKQSDLIFPSFSSPTCSLSRTRILKCSLGRGSDGQNQKPSERKSSVEVKAYVPTSEIVITSKTEVRRGLMDSVFLVSQVTDIFITELRQAIRRRAWRLQLQRNIERVYLLFFFPPYI